jgi:hypothetical protein
VVGGPEDVSQARRGGETAVDYRRKFRALLRRQSVLVGALVVMGVASRFERLERGQPTVFGIPRDLYAIGFGVLLVVVLIATAVNWRCPACRRMLGFSVPRFCRKCGVPLQ